MPRVTRSPRRAKFDPKRNIVPDRLDLRDRPYVPVLHEPPPPEMAPQLDLPVLDQADTNACPPASDDTSIDGIVQYSLPCPTPRPRSQPPWQMTLA